MMNIFKRQQKKKSAQGIISYATILLKFPGNEAHGW